MPRHSPCALHSLTLWSFKNYMSKSFAKLSFTRSALPYRARKNLNFFLSYSTLNCSVFKVQPRIIFASRILSALRKTHSLGNVSFQLTMASRFDLRSKSWLFHFCAQPFVCAALLLGHGGDEESRTPDPLLARQVLSQLSYTPMWWA